MSGPTDFCNLSNPGHIPDNAITRFEDDLDNYVGLMPETDCDHDPNQNLAHASPHWLVTNNATSNPPPIRLYSTTGDRVPYAQGQDMLQVLMEHYGTTFVVHWCLMNYAYRSAHDNAFK